MKLLLSLALSLGFLYFTGALSVITTGIEGVRQVNAALSRAAGR